MHERLLIAAFLSGLVLSSCNDDTGQVQTAEHLSQGPTTQAADLSSQPDPPTETSSTVERVQSASYWGVKEGEPLELRWEDLMPEGSEEELIRQYNEFYDALEQRYASQETTLAEAGEFSAIEEGSELDFMPQLGTFDVVEDLDGQLVRIPGYVVPLEFDSNQKESEFLFVPYMGACIHTPPPPPNQLIFVNADPAVRVKDIWRPYWLEGTMRTAKTENELGDTAYSLDLEKLDEYEMP